jgi:hypothetical protein
VSSTPATTTPESPPCRKFLVTVEVWVVDEARFLAYANDPARLKGIGRAMDAPLSLQDAVEEYVVWGVNTDTAPLEAGVEIGSTVREVM